ncbi:granulocyte-macrophage colony-stimulating factor receptor subunit alpha-like isoform X1 [Corythoichthys intestinalis]|uniref:granulocyte-macrophage colony-stimulating factor receptor subunit alpha-like isoform X1 n=1 Tax=Corythoichthys intestinalis TaxID=161448 RepID=UPI0025A63AA9|nr:granulocyte-macrophage colony-stimulating factor receptor subunit alpha-like isoform X1 [Corythoichthys intestinalis]
MVLIKEVKKEGLMQWRMKDDNESRAIDVEVCQNKKSINNLKVTSKYSSGPEHDRNIDVEIEENENFNCYLYPTNLLNCSWTFPLLKDAQLFVYISICDNNSTVHYLSLSSEEHSGSTSIALREYEMLYVIVQFNVSWDHMWIVYSYVYDTEMMEVLPPPVNIAASVVDEGLMVSWDPPRDRSNSNSRCFEYQLDVGNQEKKQIRARQVTIPNVDPACTYRARVRARKISAACLGSELWSDWSNTVTIEPLIRTLNIMVIVSIALGVPMILLTLLLLVRNQRVKQVLHPTIPCPALKYKYFLEEENILNFYRPTPSMKYEEEITVVEDTGKPFTK